ncbi:MAG TPA: hypothetical protein DEQ47_07610 [Solibacterales bacterium]|nr:hypothetical protein [Bryobacterales bacterium]
MALVVPISSQRTGQCCVLQVAPPDRPAAPIAVLLLDPEHNRLQARFRDDFSGLGLDPLDQQFCEMLAVDFERQVAGEGSGYLDRIEDSLSNFLRLTPRETVTYSSFDRALEQLFEEHVDSAFEPYITHLPVYSLRAAATRFGEDMEVEITGWQRLPPGLRPARNLFVAQVVGRSMQPLIPDGSWCVFRELGAGSRQGKRVLLQQLGANDSSAEFTVKRYTSVKRQTSEDEWRHASIRLEPLNPEFEAFDLEPDEFNRHYRVIAEFVQVLEP